MVLQPKFSTGCFFPDVGDDGDSHPRHPRCAVAFECYRNPEAMASSFGEDGYFYFGDRDKKLRKVGGENVSASQVEGFVVGLLERGLLADELTSIVRSSKLRTSRSY